MRDNNSKNDENNKDGFIFGDLDHKDEDFNKKQENGKNKSLKNKLENKNEKPSALKNLGSKNFFYILLIIAVIISVFYIIKVFLPDNNYNIKLFNIKSKTFRSKILPENNLVISGYLSNNNNYPIAFVKLKCRLYSSKNIILVTKHVYAGNFINIKKLETMSNVAINMKLHNKRGKNMSDVEILPQHPVKFMVIFLNIPSNTKNFSITVSHFYRIMQHKNISSANQSFTMTKH